MHTCQGRLEHATVGIDSIALRWVTEHWQIDVLTRRGRNGDIVSGIRVTGHADARVIRQHTLKPVPHALRAIGDDDLPRMERVANPHTTTVMKRYPGRAAGDVQQGIQDSPVGDGITASTISSRLETTARSGSGKTIVDILGDPSAGRQKI